MKLTDQAYRQFEEIWCKRNPGKPVDPDLLRLAAERLLDTVNRIYTEEFESREQ